MLGISRSRSAWFRVASKSLEMGSTTKLSAPNTPTEQAVAIATPKSIRRSAPLIVGADRGTRRGYSAVVPHAGQRVSL